MPVSLNLVWFQSSLNVLRLLQTDGRVWEQQRENRHCFSLNSNSITAFRAMAVDTLLRSSFPSLFFSRAASSVSGVGIQFCSISSAILHSALSGARLKPGRSSSRSSTKGSSPIAKSAVKHVLFLSNGHGEDSIAVSVLAQLLAVANESGHEIVVEALPLVGVGSAYSHGDISVLGPCKNMPSGGFLYMDIWNLIGDMRAGLVSLTLGQWQTIVRWMDENPDAFIVAVGDVFPLTLAWLASFHARRKRKKRSSFGYAFVGTAKSEFYVEGGDVLSSQHVKPFNVASVCFGEGVYLPWERWMMANRHCRLVAPRDGLTAEMLKKNLPLLAQAKVQDLGNPMMCDLRPSGALKFLTDFTARKVIALLPGSRAPEVYANWRVLLEASERVLESLSSNRVVFLTPVVPSLEPGYFYDEILEAGWQPRYSDGDAIILRGNSSDEKVERKQVKLWPAKPGTLILSFEKANAILILLRGGFNDAGHWADAGIAMAGTGTEQLVGLGKPVFTIPGRGPQFTYAFAEAQSRLLGKSIFLCFDCQSLAAKLREVLSNQVLLAEIAENGQKRMGTAGGARRIAEHLLISLCT